jgi:hypothetical protein
LSLDGELDETRRWLFAARAEIRDVLADKLIVTEDPGDPNVVLASDAASKRGVLSSLRPSE